jgi:enoyl-CoA hydratase/carnithine racemase
MSDSVTGRSVAGAGALELGLSDRVTDGDVWAAALTLAGEIGASFARGDPGNDAQACSRRSARRARCRCRCRCRCAGSVAGLGRFPRGCQCVDRASYARLQRQLI